MSSSQNISFTEPTAAYVHVPFCAHRCGYCNFTLVAGRDDLIDRYLAAIERELSWLERPRPVLTLFLGGGTPTHLPPRDLAKLLKTVLHWFPLEIGGEFSVEANPIDIDTERVAVLAEHRVNRVSLGAQSFHADKLRRLERDHTPDQIAAAVAILRPKVTSISLDLIFGAPDETLADWSDDLTAALALKPDHVSTYGLTFERGTTFWGRRARGELCQLDEGLEAAMYELAIDRLAAAGVERYEVSNFARPGHRCRHNETYWAAKEYFAAGPGAARYVAGRREVNHRSTTTYLSRVEAGRSPVAESETLDPEDRAREALVLGLRRAAGVAREPFAARFGFAINDLLGRHLESLVEQELLIEEGYAIRLSRRGLLLSDSIWPLIVRV
jgi:oxygen-independent coproporphyrinogen-3 oxidase